MIVFDAGALIAFINEEAGVDVVEQLLLDHSGQCFIHAVNLLEIHYDMERAHGSAHAQAMMQLISQAGIITQGDLDNAFLKDASFLKVNCKMSLADTFGVALARRLNCEFVSTDHHELDAVHAADVCDVLFIR